MATVEAGLAPWNKNYEWDLSNGWSYKKPEGWYKGIKRHQKTLHGADGQKYKVYYYPGTDYHLGFHPQDDQDRLATAQHAFDPNNPIHGEIVLAECKAGHIAKLEYAQKEQILRVTFASDGASCLFFEVPTAVAGELIYLAKKNAVRGSDGRHLVGIRFWDYIRIRGTLHGAKYPFEYESHGTGLATSRKGRHTVQIDYNKAVALFGDDKVKLKNLKPTDKVTIVLSDAEYDKLGQGIYDMALGESGSYYLQGTGSAADIDSISMNEDESYGNANSGREVFTELAKLAKNLMQGGDTIAARLKNDLDDYASVYTSTGMTDNQARQQVVREMRANNELTAEAERQLATFDLRTGRTRNIKNMRQLRDYARALGMGEMLESWLHENYPALYARRYAGRIWTTQELIDFANPTIEGNIEPRHATVYRKLVAAKDWQGALSFLKTHKTRLTYTSDRKHLDENGIPTNKRQTKPVPYAGQYDMVEGD